jgi:hypothetical protein
MRRGKKSKTQLYIIERTEESFIETDLDDRRGENRGE